MTNTGGSFTILVDNTPSQRTRGEHGFAAWIEVFGKRILFDTGQGNALLYNASTLSLDVSMINYLVLSHGHYDHTGGIVPFLTQNSTANIVLHPAALKQRFSLKEPHSPKDISMPDKAREALRALPPQRITWVQAPTKIAEGVWVTGTIPRRHSLEDTGGAFYLDPDGVHPDPLEDDMALWITTNSGIVIVTGCCHSGLINTANYIQHTTGNQRIIGIIGGFHLLNATHNRLDATLKRLRELNLEFIIPCHCTGDKAMSLMQKEFGSAVKLGFAGFKVSV